MRLLNNSVGQACDSDAGAIPDDELLCMVISDLPNYTVAAVESIEMIGTAETDGDDVQCERIQCEKVQCDDVQGEDGQDGGVQADAVAMLDCENCVIDDSSLLFS